MTETTTATADAPAPQKPAKKEPPHPRVIAIARVTHEANRGYCASLGDMSQLPWDLAAKWQQDSAIAGVQAVLDGTATTPEQQHESWLAQKVADGWIYGPEKSAVSKTHPCMVPYDDLPPEQQRKDALFRAIVVALL
jgi:hypothetical protein